MKKHIAILFTSLLLLVSQASHADFTVAMYKQLKELTVKADAESSKKAGDMIDTYLMGVASGVSEISQFEKVGKGIELPYCLPKGTRITPSFARYIVDSLLSDKDVKLDNVDDISLSRIYVIGLLRFYRCQ
ncbi:hypothetical protein KC222_10220 [Cedecea davisae]|uniref:Uncharacterized protein n=1 Tax=Cedecea davisae TaxID=158484 RepID=A0ABS6DH35_9ENTR|nr:hypothetical protein [Cedecea davisae]MBU4682390.1 hypothetical protein [Cedecea davisae]MBU4688420.1 hypothetical protein [Cedecea davisae]